MRQFCGYLAANLTVAANLRVHEEREARDDRARVEWDYLDEVAHSIGCAVLACYLDAECDGQCGCGVGLLVRDRPTIGTWELFIRMWMIIGWHIDSDAEFVR